ncbi:MAG: DUF2784 domain-containing protein [Thiobacillaceae bacterium]|nr:DUF2784 domain-containing protein [Thiobacillaceae bacterium]
MPHALLADLILLLHLAFILFVVLGGLLVYRHAWVAWLHVPAVVWGVVVELMGWICPLTPLENRLRALAGQGGYDGDFIGAYLLAVIYPDGLTREIQIGLGLGALLLNLLVYARLLARRRR